VAYIRNAFHKTSFVMLEVTRVRYIDTCNDDDDDDDTTDVLAK